MERYDKREKYVFILMRCVTFAYKSIYFFILFIENQGNILARKQLQAQQNREDARIKKQIETAHKEMARLEKYANVKTD